MLGFFQRILEFNEIYSWVNAIFPLIFIYYADIMAVG